VVDDTLANLMAFEITLANIGIDVVLATSGQEALALLLRHEFAVILLDVRMPGMDGLETASLIRKRGRAQYTPIIFVSAYEKTPLEVAQGYLAGAIDYLYSPVNADTLRRKVVGFVEVYRKNQEFRLRAEELGRTCESQKAQIRELEDAVASLRQELARGPLGQPS
jgi:CheY-like chemotaxis protein